MRLWLSLAVGTALLGTVVLPGPVLAQQKTVKACADEWRANKAEHQAKGVTERAYVTQCRAGAAAVKRGTDPVATPRTVPAAAPETQKTVKACQTEWRDNKAAYQAAKITEKAYVDKCRAGETVALPSAPAAKPAQAPTPSATAPAPTAPAPAPSAAAPARVPAGRTPAPTATTAPTAANQFQTEAQAKSHCPSDMVVWANIGSKIYHFSGHKSYGTTKQGAYMCEKDATAQGIRASKTEKRPSS